ncbi:hypothetical protein QBC41DRAFT_280106 [Cercophora samala]|uniref:Uncharacterized protein n=1 Tax=Cercophora samala TaxID=330535 RepID=A0AA40D868_9PEZI|nr:hypothetical protein QBC41DRAFT_280106 [Cercophora samala]
MPPIGYIDVGGNRNNNSSSGSNDSNIHLVPTPLEYFLGSFAPTILSLLFSLPWLFLDVMAKRMEPFYKLSSSQGARASESLCVSYHTMLPETWQAFLLLFRKDWVVSLTSFLVTLSQILTMLSSDAVQIGVIGDDCRANVQCYGALAVSLGPARALEIIMGVMILFTIVLAALLWKRQSRLQSEPFSLAGVAILANDPLTLRRIQEQVYQPDEQPGNEWVASWEDDTRYRIMTFRNEDGTLRNGLIQDTRERSTTSLPSFDTKGTQAIRPRAEYEPTKRSNPIVWETIVLLLFVVGILTITIWYYLNDDQVDPFERFLSGQGFGVRFLFTGVGIVINGLWEKLFLRITMLLPYVNMSGSTPAQAQDSVLFKPSSSPISALFSKSTYRHFSLGLVTLNSNLALVLTIALTNVPFSNQRAMLDFLACIFLSWGILGVMILSLLVLLAVVHAPELPLPPDSIATKLFFLSAGPTIPRLFGPFSMLNTEDRDKAITNSDAGWAKYRFGWLRYWDQEMVHLKGQVTSVQVSNGTLEEKAMTLGIEFEECIMR